MHNGGLIEHLVYPQLPASKVIARSRLVITHGGAGSSYQALAQAVPLGVWPSHQNQYLLGSLIQKAGCGVLLEDALAGSVDIAKGLNSMRAHGRKLAGSLGNVNGPRKAAEVILRMLR